MRNDVAFQIGKTHDICEDFALAGTFGEEDEENRTCYAVVSDGCSSSSGTDLGSRILSYSVVSELKNLYRNNNASLMFSFNSDSCISKARASIESLGVADESLDATVLMAKADKYDTTVVVKGDGCVVFGLPDKRMLVVNFEFPSGFPFYMNYLPEYSNRFGGWYKINNPDESGCVITTSILNTDGSYEELDKECSPQFYFSPDKETASITIKQDYYGGYINLYTAEKNNPEFLVLMSDGISSFYETEDTGTSLTNKDIDYRTVISEVLGFKNFNGKFMQRRLNRFLKSCVKKNWHHADDISFGAMYFE